jgi:opacity protein-like surface antigen
MVHFFTVTLFHIYLIMKKFLFLSILSCGLFLTCSSKLNAQAFMPGDFIISAGYGTPNLSKSVFKTWENYSDYNLSGFGPLHLKGEYAVAEHFGLGVSVNYSNTKITFDDQGYNYTLKYNPLSVNIRGNVHFGSNDKFDPYLGIGVGYGYRKWDLNSSDPDANEFLDNISSISIPIGLEATLGARYYFTDNIGVFVEAGPAKSLVQLGLSFKLSSGGGRY